MFIESRFPNSKLFLNVLIIFVMQSDRPTDRQFFLKTILISFFAQQVLYVYRRSVSPLKVGPECVNYVGYAKQLKVLLIVKTLKFISNKIIFLNYKSQKKVNCFVQQGYFLFQFDSPRKRSDHSRIRTCNLLLR